MTAKEVRVPDIGDAANVTVIEILVAPGDAINEGDSLVMVESDKATLEIPSDASGTVLEVTVSVNDQVSEGNVILTLDAGVPVDSTETPPDTNTHNNTAARPEIEQIDARRVAATNDPADSPAESSTTPHSPGETDVDQSRVQMQERAQPAYATPSTRKLARQLGVDIQQVEGSGPKHRITRDDVYAFVKSRMKTAGNSQEAVHLPSTQAALPAWPTIDFELFGTVKRQPLSRINRLSAKALARNAMVIPHVTHFDKANITQLENFRETLNSEADPDDVKLTILAFVVKAVVAALQQFPKFNSSLDGDELILKQYWNIGIATNTPAGLLVPVLKDANSKGLRDIANEMSVLAAAARNSKLGPADMQGATFTISSLGAIGGTNFTPIINAPEVAILGLPRSEIQPVWDGTQFQPARIQPLSLSFDHRVIDGVAAAQFLKHIAVVLQDFQRNLL